MTTSIAEDVLFFHKAQGKDITPPSQLPEIDSRKTMPAGHCAYELLSETKTLGFVAFA